MTDENPRPEDSRDEAAREDGTGAALTIADAARAATTDRHSIRRRLHAGEFPNAFKDTQGFWRIYESDLSAAGVAIAGSGTGAEGESRADAEAPAADPSTGPTMQPATGDNESLRLEIGELRHRVATAEALLAAERRLSEELSRALQVARRTGDALLATVAGPNKEPRAPEPRPAPAPPQPRPNWQAELRAARAREAQIRAAREREAKEQASSRDAGS